VRGPWPAKRTTGAAWAGGGWAGSPFGAEPQGPIRHRPKMRGRVPWLALPGITRETGGWGRDAVARVPAPRGRRWSPTRSTASSRY